MAEAVRAAEKPQFVVEKDYALSYLLAGIAETPLLRDSLVFKGGTCLRKLYFPGYRFSEDLDFTSRETLTCEALLQALDEAAERMTTRLQSAGPFAVVVTEEAHRDPHPRGQCVFRVQVQFPWMRTPSCRVKVEVTAGESLLAGAVERRLIHDFPGEALEAVLPAYRLEEVASEKLRALLQSRQHLRDRGWLRNRPRDLYDLRHLWEQRDFEVDWQLVAELLPGKAETSGVTFTRAEDFLDNDVLAGIQRDWSAQLANFVPELPTFEDSVSTLRTILSEVIPRT
jgi:predicted nucleotidyltransferase component of viral defense system